MKEPTMGTVTLVAANTQYTYPIGECRRFEFHSRSVWDDIRFAFATGHVATSVNPFWTLHGGQQYFSYPLDWRVAGAPLPDTLYLASATAGAIVEIMTWR